MEDTQQYKFQPRDVVSGPRAGEVYTVMYQREGSHRRPPNGRREMIKGKSHRLGNFHQQSVEPHYIVQIARSSSTREIAESALKLIKRPDPGETVFVEDFVTDNLGLIARGESPIESAEEIIPQ